MAAREEVTLSNGLRVVVVRRGTVPLVAVRLVVLAGSCLNPNGKSGLSDFTARLMRRGTAHRTADEINEAVEFVGASLGLGSDEDAMSLGLSTPVAPLGRMLEVLAELIQKPAFPRSELQSEKERALAQFANDLDDPGLLADRAMLRALWQRHPYAHEVTGTRRDVASFTREDVVRFHAEQVGPKVSTLYVVGPVEAKQVARMAERAFGGWSGGPSAPSWPRVPERRSEAKVVVVDKPEQTQSQVRLGAPGYARGSPDFFPGVVLNTVLGAGFTSRLMNEIRVNRGLSYGASSHFQSLKLGGSFNIATFTKTETTGDIIQVALGEVAKLRQKGFRPGEMGMAQRYIAGLYPLRTEGNEALASVLGDIDLYGLGEDWVERYRDRIHAVTRKQAASVAERYLFPAPPTLVVVGNAAKVVKQLSRFGKPEVVKPTEVE